MFPLHDRKLSFSPIVEDSYSSSSAGRVYLLHAGTGLQNNEFCLVANF